MDDFCKIQPKEKHQKLDQEKMDKFFETTREYNKMLSSIKYEITCVLDSIQYDMCNTLDLNVVVVKNKYVGFGHRGINPDIIKDIEDATGFTYYKHVGWYYDPIHFWKEYEFDGIDMQSFLSDDKVPLPFQFQELTEDECKNNLEFITDFYNHRIHKKANPEKGSFERKLFIEECVRIKYDLLDDVPDGRIIDQEFVDMTYERIKKELENKLSDLENLCKNVGGI